MLEAECFGGPYDGITVRAYGREFCATSFGYPDVTHRYQMSQDDTGVRFWSYRGVLQPHAVAA